MTLFSRVVAVSNAMPHRLELNFGTSKPPTHLKPVNAKSCCSEHSEVPPHDTRLSGPRHQVCAPTNLGANRCTYPGAHLSLNRWQSPRRTSTHPTFYAFSKAFMSKPDVPYSKPYKLGGGRSSAAWTCRLQFLAFNSRIVGRLRKVVSHHYEWQGGRVVA